MSTSGVRRGTRRRVGRIIGLSMASVLLAAGAVVAVPGTSGAVDVCNGNWAPLLRDITINQGLGTYTPVTRGKTTLVRLFLGTPSCAPQNSERLTGATLTAKDGTQTLVSGLATTPAALGPNYPTIDSSS